MARALLFLLPALAVAAEVDIESLRIGGTDLREVYFVGDLHGDAGCAREWVNATGLVVNGTWTRADAALVFLGDYVDKGIDSRGVMEFVRGLVEAFPDRVAAIAGNHDLFMLLDNTLDASDPRRPLGTSSLALPYSFFHPEEYPSSGFSPPRADDGELLDELLEVLGWVYAARATRHVLVDTEEVRVSGRYARGRRSLWETSDGAWEAAGAVRERLGLWQKEYRVGLHDTGAIGFLRARPLVAVVGDALVVHGGLPPEHVDAAAEHVAAAAGTDWRALSAETQAFAAAVTQDRAFHGRDGCELVREVLERTGLGRVVVGHTPHDDVTQRCGGKLVAADSSLSRPFRANGNYYCPAAGGGTSPVCERPVQRCEGSIARLSRSAGAPWPAEAELVRLHDRGPFGSRPFAAFYDRDAPSAFPTTAVALCLGLAFLLSHASRDVI